MDLNLLYQDVPALLAVIVGVPAILAGYIVGGEFLVRRLPDKQRPRVRPWIWVGPALIFVTAFLVLPALGTVVTSFQDHEGNFVGLHNFERQLADFPSGGAWIAIRNNLYWLILYTLIVLFFGLILAVLFDRVRYESVVKSLIFLPMGISSVALGVIWKFMYWYQPGDAPQTGTLNFIVVNWFHQAPKTWLSDSSVNNFALIAAAIWGITGFALVILSAALK
ncbi:MAG: sugar ABC transporter permease, partial [Chloroflexi bacterium]